jgi:hypothetical protein
MRGWATFRLPIKRLSRVHCQFVSPLLEQFPATYPDAPILSAEEMVVPVSAQISPREREILRLLDAGLDNTVLLTALVLTA